MFDFGKTKQLKAEKARLEAFLSAVPGEYCGFSHDGTMVYSQGFCDILGLSSLTKISDINHQLSVDDVPVFEGVVNRLCENKIPFTLNAHDRSGEKTWKISGSCGEDISQTDVFCILWVEDMTALHVTHNLWEEEQASLRAENETLSDSLDTLPYPVWIRDETQKITWCNVAYAKMIDAVPSEIIAQQIEISDPDRPRTSDEKTTLRAGALARAAIEKKCKQNIEVHETYGGHRLFLNICEVPRGDKGTVGICVDMTAQEHIKNVMDNHIDAHRGILEQLRSAIGVYSADHTLEFYNTAFSQLWGLEEGWLNTRPKLGEVMEKLREARRLPEQADFRSYKKTWLNMFTDLIDTHDEMLYLPDNSALRMLVVPHKLGGITMIFEDVTSRLELETSYNTLVEVQKETLDHLAEGVVVYGGDGRVKLWNPAFSALWGFDPETLEGGPHVTRIVEKNKRFFTDDIWNNVKDELTFLALDRTMRHGRLERVGDTIIDYVTAPMPDGGVMVTFDDVTDKVRVENALRDKNIALETAEQLKLDFLANVSYQLRTPLNAIMGFNDMLSQEFFGDLNDKQKEYTRDIHGASDRLLNLINDILDLSTIEAGQMNLDIETVSIKHMIDNVVALVQDWARKEKIEITVKCPQNIGKAEIDETRIKQAIINVIRNAIAHTPANGVIALQAKRSGDDVSVIISDNGKGIAEEEHHRILKPFERVNEQQSTGRGAGLGLSLVKNITALHNGTFDLKSAPGKGTHVTLSFPRMHMKKNQQEA